MDGNYDSEVDKDKEVQKDEDYTAACFAATLPFLNFFLFTTSLSSRRWAQNNRLWTGNGRSLLLLNWLSLRLLHSLWLQGLPWLHLLHLHLLHWLHRLHDSKLHWLHTSLIHWLHSTVPLMKVAGGRRTPTVKSLDKKG